MEAENRELKELVRNIMYDYSTITGLACIFVGISGNVQSEKFNFTDFCQNIRRIPEYRMKCRQCDMCGGLEAMKQKTCYPYVCHAGLVDFSIPIIQGEQLHGFIVSGQMNYTDSGISYLQTPSDFTEYPEIKNELLTVPKYSYGDIMSAARVLNAMTRFYFPCADLAPGGNGIIRCEGAVDNPSFSADNRPEIKKTLEYIRTHLGRDLSLRKIAEQVYLSESYLSRLFKHEMQVSLVTYINQCRIMEAEKLLRETKETIENISHKLGYKRPSYFCKLFRQTVGDTPHVYRQKQKLNSKEKH